MTDVVDVINALSFASFFVLLAVGVLSTLSRVAYYRAHGFRRPRLLVRDAWMIGGFTVSFGLILLIRVLRAFGLDTSGLAANPWWAVGSALPAITAVAVYAYFELFVIERGRDEVRDETYLRPRRPDEPPESEA